MEHPVLARIAAKGVIGKVFTVCNDIGIKSNFLWKNARLVSANPRRADDCR